MSIALMSLAWDADIQTNMKMALLAMCDWANDQGGSVHPSINTLAKRISCSSRQAQRILHSLIEAGWLSVVGNEFGGAPGATRQYQINVQKLKTGDTSVTGDKLTGVTSTTQTGDTSVVRRVTYATETGDIGVTLTTNRTTIDPSIEPPIRKKLVQAEVEVPAWLPSGAFADFVEFRKSIKKPMNRKAMELAIGQLEKLKNEGQSPVDVINQSILNGWQGLFAVNRQTAKPAPARVAGKHSGFTSLDYKQGINDDGSF